MFHSRILDAKYLVAALLALGLAAVGPSCSSGGDGGGGDGGEGGTGPAAEICGNELDDDQDGLTDCLDDECAQTPLCCPNCEEPCYDGGQDECEAGLICSPEGRCEQSGLVDVDGRLRKGEALVMSKMAEINATMNYAGQQLLVLSSERPNTADRASCEAIMARDLDPTDPTQVNVVYETAIQVSAEDDYIPAPAFGVPLPKEGHKLIAVVRFFGATPDINKNPRGDIVGEGCAEFDSIPEGYYAGDEANPDRQWEVIIRLFCGGYLNRACPEPKECVVGLCRDTRCGSCGPGYTCREWDGQPDCRKTCNPDSPDCPNLHYCDTTPGEPFVCVPADGT